MPTIYATEQEKLILNGYIIAYCGNAVSALLIYEWLLCLGQEVRFVWGRRSVATVASVVYILSRYAMLIQYVVAIATNFPMSDLLYGEWMDSECLRDLMYPVIQRLLCPACIRSVKQELMADDHNIPPGAASGFGIHLSIVGRATTFVTELLVVSLSWWYSYHSYRISKDIKIGETISGLILYNGSIYFLFLAALYIIDIILHTASVPEAIATAHNVIVIFYDPMTSILVCRFMLSLRQFDARIASATNFGMGSQTRGDTTVLQFAARTSDSLPDFLATFANPVHVESGLGDSDGALMDNEFERWGEIDGVASLPNPQDVVLLVRGPNKPSNVDDHV